MSLKHSPFHPFLIVAFQILTVYSININEASFSSFMFVLFISLLFTSFVYFIISLFINSKLSAIVVTFYGFLFFAYGRILDIIIDYSIFSFDFGRNRYLLPFYAILRSVPDKLLGVIAMFASIFILVILPWLDTSKVRSAIFRPLYRQFYWILVIDVILLGYMGAMPAEGIYLLIARVATAYYFIHFLIILPMLGKKEKTNPIPLSISEPVLGGYPNQTKTKDRSIL